jgi:anaphase-promoting complex subunit 3
VLRRLGDGYRHLHQYRGIEAIAAFEKLSALEGNTAWAYVQIATAYFNMAQYQQAEQAFKKARKLEPSRILGMELYSTVLWFLKKEHELCYLAQELVALDRQAPQTWCVLGNCFSVQREFETAIKFFQRAIQVCPSFTYAYTLVGHEHVSNEDFEKATASFRNSLRADERHYNAWYGLAIIYLKQEKYQLAEYHLRRALAINPRNSVLYCYLGIVLLSAGACMEALQVLQDAIDLDPANPLAKLRKAMALSHLDRNTEALEELQQLQQLAPRESMVYMQMGKVLKKLGRLQEALACFNHAIDLDPKGGNAVKAQIDRLQIQDLEEDESFL